MEFSKILLDKISYYLRERNEKISVAESVTSGLVQLAFSQMPSAERFFEGGITAYTIDQKVRHLYIDFEKAQSVNRVSRSITDEMPLNIAKLFKTEWSIATTGYSTPVRESDNDIFAFYAISYKGHIILSEKIELHTLTRSLDAQSYFTECVLSALRCEVKHLKLFL
ncbi:CinA family protein [Chryseobacterium sp.]|uniref:CinA family protein n=1 Tax=Chryseobacterium sp. TaxID=1871047 RepID=UPI0028998058|nr:CinA family protein [Chryseobacterium sp.]